MKKLIRVTAVVIALMSAVFVNSASVFAADGVSSIFKNMFYAQGFLSCYSGLRSDILLEESPIDDVKDLFINSDAAEKEISTAGSGTITCAELISRTMSVDKLSPNDFDTLGNLLNKIGYTATDTGIVKCARYYFNIINMDNVEYKPLPGPIDDKYSPGFCITNLTEGSDGDYVISDRSFLINLTSGIEYGFFKKYNDDGLAFYAQPTDGGVFEIEGVSPDIVFDSSYKIVSGISFNGLAGFVNGTFSNNKDWIWPCIYGTTDERYGCQGNPTGYGPEDNKHYYDVDKDTYSIDITPPAFSALYSKPKKSEMFRRFYEGAFGRKYVNNDDESDIKFVPQPEKQSAFYYDYLVNYYGIQVTENACDEDKSVAESMSYAGNDLILAKVYLKGTNDDFYSQYCWVRETTNSGKNVFGVGSNNQPVTVNEEKVSFSDIVDWLNDNGSDVIRGSWVQGSPSYVDPGDGGGDEEGQQDGCWASGSGVGWVICPVLNFVGGALDTVYDYVEGFLRVDPKLFSDGNNTVYNAWNQFRNFANIIFVILLLFVIFSQLTGYGIDNYGIKKILPKLIVAAVLINLSYVICQICVDLSNIIGNGLQALFNSLSESLGELSINVVDDGSSIASGFSTGQKVLISSSLVAALIAGLVIVAVNPMVLISLLVAALGVLIGVLFLFVLLVARQAIVIILITISPIAFALNILPNTKKLFSKWVKIGEAMLLLYPICGLLVGGGNYVSKLLLSVSSGGGGNVNLPMALASSVVGIAPIFFIPSVLKGSFAGLGKVGGMLTGLSSKARKGTTKAAGGAAKRIGQTDTFRNVKNRVAMRMPGRKRRARAVQDQSALLKEKAERKRLAGVMGINSRDVTKTRLGAISASEEAKAYDERTSQELSLMKKNGIKLGDESTKAFGYEGLTKRMSELAKREKLTPKEKQEMQAVAKGLAATPGGIGYLANIITEENPTESFMENLGTVLSMDSSVYSELSKKDGAVFEYAEKYMKGGTRPNESFKDYRDKNYDGIRSRRFKTYEAGLRQRGAAARYYIERLDKADVEKIMKDEKLVNSLDIDTRLDLEARAGELGVGFSKAGANVGVTGSTSTSGRGDSAATSGISSVSGLGASSVSAPAPSNSRLKSSDVSGVGDTFSVTSTSGEHTFTRQTNGRWVDENGNEMGGSFGTRIGQNSAIQQQIQENRRKSDIYRGMSDDQIQKIVHNANPRSAKVQESARKEAERRGLVQTGEQQQQAQRMQQEEVMRVHEEDAMRRGKTNINIPGSLDRGTVPGTIQGYAVPTGFNQGGIWSREANGDHIYTEPGADGRKWNASTGRYIRKQ